MVAKQKIYSDLNISLAPHPITGDMTKIYDDNSVSQAIKSLILTNHYEKPFQPWIGGNLIALLFEPVSSMTEFSIRRNIENTIEQYEPRAILLDTFVRFREEYNEYEISIKFKTIGQDKPATVSLILRRAR